MMDVGVVVTHELELGHESVVLCAVFAFSVVSFTKCICCCNVLYVNVGCGISFQTPSIIGPSISVVTPSLLAILGAHVEHCYARLCRVPDLEILFLSEAIATNSM